MFKDLKFTCGTFPNPARIRFSVGVQLNERGKPTTRSVIESYLSNPFVAMTNTGSSSQNSSLICALGSQWKEAAFLMLRDDCFLRDPVKGIYDNEVPTAKFWNYFQKHYLIATKQFTAEEVQRPLTLRDFNFMYQVLKPSGPQPPSLVLLPPLHPRVTVVLKSCLFRLNSKRIMMKSQLSHLLNTKSYGIGLGLISRRLDIKNTWYHSSNKGMCLPLHPPSVPLSLLTDTVV